MRPPTKLATMVGIIGELPTPKSIKTNAKIGVDNCQRNK